MRTPWFMHSPRGRNSGFGVYPTSVGTFVRSCENGDVEVTWYPVGNEFEGGANREAVRVVRPNRQIEEAEIDQAIEDFMHAHPVLCMVVHRIADLPDIPWIATREIETQRQSRIAVFSAEHGDYVRTHREGFLTVRYVPGGRGTEMEISQVADACGDDLARKRSDAMVRRHDESITHAAAGKALMRTCA